MILLLLLLLQTVPDRAVVSEELLAIPAGSWHEQPLLLKQQGGEIHCSFAVAGPQRIRVALVRRQDLKGYLSNPNKHFVVATPYSQSTEFEVFAEKGEYVLVFDNRSAQAQPATASVRVTVGFGGACETKARELPAERKFAVILTSLVIFAGALWFGGSRVIAAFRLRHRRTPGPFPPYS